MIKQHNTSQISQKQGIENIGIEYQYRVITYVAASLSENSTVKDYTISSNVCNIPVFDDIIIKVWYHEEECPYAYLGQVKHRSKPIDFNCKEKHKLSDYKQNAISIIKRKDSIELLQDVPVENVHFFFYSNKDLIQHDLNKTNKKTIPLPYITDVDATYKTPFPLKVSGKCYKFIAPDNINYEDSIFLNKIRLFLNQTSNEQVLHDIVNLFGKEFSLKVTRELTRNVHEYFRCSKVTTITKDIFETELLRTRLSKYIVKPKIAVEMNTDQARLWNEVTFNYDIIMVDCEKNVESYLFGCFLQKLNDMCNCNFKWNDLVVNENGKLSNIFSMQLFRDPSKPNKIMSWFGEPDTIDLLLEQMWRSDNMPLILKMQAEIPFLTKYRHLGKKFILICDVEEKLENMKTMGWKIFESVADIQQHELRSHFLKSIHVSLQGRHPVSLENVVDHDIDCMRELKSFQILHLIKKRKAYLEDRSLEKVEQMVVIKTITNKDIEKSQVFAVENIRNKNVLITCYNTNLEFYTELIRQHPKFQYYSYHYLEHNINGLEYISGDMENVKSFLVDEDGNHIHNSISNEYVPIIGSNLLNYEGMYISRSFHKPIINPKIFEKGPRVYFLYGDLETLDTEIKNKIIKDPTLFVQHEITSDNRDNILFDTRKYSGDICKEIADHLGLYPILYLEVERGNLGLLHYRNCNDLSSYLSYNEDIISESRFFEQSNPLYCNNQITVITGEAGTGKTTLLHSLSKIYDGSCYVLFCDLAECRQYIKHLGRSECPLDYVFSKYTSTKSRFKDFLPVIYKYHKSIGKVILFVDSFDEISSIYEEKVLDFIKRVAKTKTKVIIASRSIAKNVIINKIDVQPLQIADLRTYEALAFFNRKRIKVRLSRIPKEFLVNPLHLKLLYFLPEKEMLHFTDIDKIYLYNKAIIEITKKYYHKMGVFDDDEIKSQEKDILNIHELMAMTIIFGEEWLVEQKIIINYKTLVNEFDSQKIKLGLVKEFNDGYPTFIHQTFVEYLAAKWLSENMFKEENPHNIYMGLLYKCDANIKYFFDAMVCKNLELHRAVLKGDLTLVQDICRNHNINIESVDKCGRNSLHLALEYCSDQQHYRITELLLNHLLRRKYDLSTRDRFRKRNFFFYFEDNLMSYHFRSNICNFGLTTMLKTFLKFQKGNLYIGGALHNRNFRTLLFLFEINIFSSTVVFNQAITYAIEYGCLNTVCELINLYCKNDLRLNVFLKVCQNLCETTQLKNAEYMTELTVKECNFTALHIACLHGHVSLVKQLLELRADIVITDNFKRTALHYACIQGSVEIIGLLLKSTNAAIVNLEDQSGRTPLYLAVKHSKLNAIQLLIENGAAISRGFEDTILKTAARISSVKTCKFLLKNSVGGRYTNTNISSAFLVATESGNLDIAHFLLNHGANIFYKHYDGNTALHIACFEGHDKIVEYLLKKSYKMSTFKNSDSLTPMDIAVLYQRSDIIDIFTKYKEVFNYPHEIEPYVELLEDDDRYTPLHLIKSAKEAKLLLLNDEIISKINAKADNGETPLHVACRNGYYDVVEILLLKNADIFIHDISGQTSLHVAIENGNIEIAKMLLKYGASVNITNNFMETPLHCTIRKRSTDLVRLLLKNGTKINQQNYDGRTALHIAAKLVDTEIVEILLDNHADVNQTDYWETTALHISVDYQNIETVKLFLERGATVNHSDNCGNTALHIAVENQNLDIVEVLLRNAAANSYLNNKNESAVDIAARKENANIQTKLLQNCIDTDNFDNCKDSCLKIAVLGEYVDIAKMVIEKGANINHFNNVNLLHIAVEQNNRDMIKLLLDKNMNVNKLDHGNDTALNVAVRYENLQVVRILLKNGANVNCNRVDLDDPLHIALNLQNLVISELLLKYKSNIQNDHMALQIAINKQSVDILNMLLKYGVDIMSLTTSNVHIYLHSIDRDNDIDFVKVLLENSKCVNIRCKCNKSESQVLLESGVCQNTITKYDTPTSNLAILEENLGIANLLLETGTDINLLRFDMQSVLQVAIELENMDFIYRLIDAGVDINYLSLARGSALHVAIDVGNMHCVELLLEKGINVNLVSQYKGSALYVAVEKENMDIINLLMNSDIDVNLPSFYSGSALHIATELENVEIVKLLLENGVYTEIEDARRNTALEIACIKENMDIIELIVEKYNNIKRLYIIQQTLSLAVKEGNLNLVKVLLAKRIDQNIMNEYITAVFNTAIQKENIDIVKLLIGKRTNVNLSFTWERLPLTIAIEKNNTDMVKLLLKTTNIDIFNEDPIRKKSALHIAIEEGNIDIVKLLIAKCTDININASQNKSLLLTAIRGSHAEIFNFLVETLGVDIKNEASVICEAVYYKNLQITKLLLEKGITVNDGNNSALHVATYEGYANIAKVLVEANININLVDKHGSSALHYAVTERNIDVAKVLLQKGIDTNITNKLNETALHIAVQKRDGDIVKLLLEWVDIDKFGGVTEDPILHKAIIFENTEILKILLQKGIDINSRDIPSNESALHIAIYYDKINRFNLLVEAGIDIDVVDLHKQSALHAAVLVENTDMVKVLLEKKINVNNVNYRNNSALHIAVERENKDIVKMLVEASIDTGLVNYTEESVLHIAVKKGNTYIMKLLLEKGINLNVNYLDHWKNSALHIAIEKEDDDIVKYLIKADTDTSLVNFNGESVLHIAVRKGNANIVKLLLEKGINVNIMNRWSNSALHMAIEKENIEITKLLLETVDIDTNLVNISEETALHIAVVKNNTDIAKMLVKAGTDINLVNFNKESVLHIATGKGNTEIVKLLLQAGIDVNIVDCHERTVLHVAIQYRNMNIARLLNYVS